MIIKTVDGKEIESKFDVGDPIHYFITYRDAAFAFIKQRIAKAPGWVNKVIGTSNWEGVSFTYGINLIDDKGLLRDSITVREQDIELREYI